MQIKVCPVCDKEFTKRDRTSGSAWQMQKCCSYECSRVHMRKETTQRKERRKNYFDCTPKIKYADEQQKELDRKIDDRYAVKLASKVLEHGSPEWEEACRAVTPIHLVRSNPIDLRGLL